MTQPWQGWYPGREPFLLPLASPGASSGAGVREREEGRLGEFPRLSCSFHKSPQSRWRQSREVRGAGAQRGGTRHLPFPTAFFLSVLFFFFPPNLPLSLLARVAALAQQPDCRSASAGCCRPPSPPPACARTPGSESSAAPGSRPGCQPRAPGGRRRRSSRRHSVAGAARVSRGPAGGPLPLPPAAGAGDGGRPRSRAVAGRPLSLEAAAARAEASGPGEESFAGCADRARGAPPVALSLLPGALRRGVGGGSMAREPEEEERAGAAARARGCRGLPGRAGAGALRPSLWLSCLVACWLLGAVAHADFSILDEAQVLASQMRRLAAEELGVVTMQVRGSHGAPILPGILPLLRRAPSRVQVPLTVHRPLWHAQPPPPSLSRGYLCSLHRVPPAPICTPTLPCTRYFSSFPLQKSLLFARDPLSLPPSSFISARILRFPRTSFPNVHDSPPQSGFYPVAPANFPSLFVYPSRGSRPRLTRMIFRGPQPTPGPPPRIHPYRAHSGAPGGEAPAAAPGPPGSLRREALSGLRAPVPAGCPGGGAGLVDSWWIPDSCPVGETFVVIAIVRCVLSAVRSLFCFVPVFWGWGVGT